jgi:hypothetical protein
MFQVLGVGALIGDSLSVNGECAAIREPRKEKENAAC